MFLLNRNPHTRLKRTELNGKYKYLRLLNNRSTQTLENKLLIYSTILKPAWTYGIEQWGPPNLQIQTESKLSNPLSYANSQKLLSMSPIIPSIMTLMSLLSETLLSLSILDFTQNLATPDLPNVAGRTISNSCHK